MTKKRRATKAKKTNQNAAAYQKKQRVPRGHPRKTERVGEEERRFNWRPLLLVFLWLVFFSVAAYIFFWSPYLTVTHIVISGNDKTSYDELRSHIVAATEGKNEWQIERGNFFFYPEERLRASIAEEFVFVKDVESTKKFSQTINIVITEIEEIVVACPTGEARDGCVEVRENGSVGRAVTFTEPRYQKNRIVTFAATPGADFSDGSNLIDADVRAFLPVFDEELLFTLGIRPAERYAMSTAARGDFSVRTDEGWELRFDATDDVTLVLKRLAVLFERTDLGASRSDLEYIDTRFGDRIFYKRLDAAPDTEVVNEESS